MTAHTEMLKKVSLFANVSDQELEKISSMLQERTVTKDQQIVARDEPGDSMFIIKRGRVKVLIEGDGGREVTLTMLKTGDFFGEMALLDDLPRSASVTAAEDARLLVLKRDQFAEHVKNNPAMALNIMAELSRRLRRADEI